MRLLFILLVPCLLVGIINNSSNGKEPVTPEKKALQIAKRNAGLPDSIRQLLVVFNETAENSLAVLVALEKKGKVWRVVSAPIPAGIGRKGFAAPGTKREGDQQSPSGFFRLGQLFCYDKDVNTRIPFIQTTPVDKWIDDPNSPDYNRHVRGETQAKSYENLKIRSDEYKYCMVIEYNTHPVVKDMGSAIFLHLSEGENPNPSAGCVVVTESDVEWLLNWMKPEFKPSILMGNDKVLMSGFLK
ncbi:MAG: L,D-transpeptidase family protein [Bacteroidota bacterium]|nr:L,D-transpeptidase family protein [Bacteroidota bacterium]